MSIKDYEGVMDSFIAEQLRRIGGGVPARRLSLRELLTMKEPSVETSSGGKHYFRRADLEKAASVLSDELKYEPIFPIIFTLRDDIGRDVYAIQGGHYAATAFATLMGLRDVSKTSEGIYYSYKVLVYEFIRRYPSLCVITF